MGWLCGRQQTRVLNDCKKIGLQMKSFKQYNEEMTTAADAGIPQDTKDMGPKKKKKYKILTRGFIEVAGKRKRLKK